MSLLWDCTSWKQWGAPRDVFNLVLGYLSPNLCYYCGGFKASYENFCEPCYRSRLEDYEFKIRFLEDFIEYVTPRIGAGGVRGVYEQWMSRYYTYFSEKSKHIRREILGSPSPSDTYEKLLKKHQDIIKYLGVTADNYFDRIKCDEHFLLKKECIKDYEKTGRLRERIDELNKLQHFRTYIHNTVNVYVTGLLDDYRSELNLTKTDLANFKSVYLQK